MFKKISAVKPFAKQKILVWFEGGEVRAYDLAPIIRKRAQFKPLKDPALFSEVRVDAGGYGISWNEDIDMASNELYDEGTPVNVVESEGWRVVGEVVEARHAAGVSQAKLAAAAGLKQPVIARLETGVNSPRLETLLRVLTPMGKTIKVVDLEPKADLGA